MSPYGDSVSPFGYRSFIATAVTNQQSAISNLKSLQLGGASRRRWGGGSGIGVRNAAAPRDA